MENGFIWKLAVIVAAIWLLVKLHTHGCILCGVVHNNSFADNTATESGLNNTPLQTGDGSSGTGCGTSALAQGSYSDAAVPALSASSPVNPLAHYGRVPISNIRIGERYAL